MYSKKELFSKRQEWNKQSGATSRRPRHEDFGREGSTAPSVKVNASALFGNSRGGNGLTGLQFDRNARNRQVQQVLQQNAAPVAGGLFGSNSSAVPPPPAPAVYASQAPQHSFGGTSRMMARKSAPGGPVMYRSEEKEEEIDYSDEDMGFGLFDDGPSGSAPKQLTFEEGAWEESGMTTVSKHRRYILRLNRLT